MTNVLVYASSNKVFFSLWQNCPGENDIVFRDDGRLMQQVGPETANESGPYHTVLVHGTLRSPRVTDGRWRHVMSVESGMHISDKWQVRRHKLALALVGKQTLSVDNSLPNSNNNNSSSSSKVKRSFPSQQPTGQHQSAFPQLSARHHVTLQNHRYSPAFTGGTHCA